MTYIINGKRAYLVAKKNGINAQTFYQRIRLGYPVEYAATKKSMRARRTYTIKKDGEIKIVCLSTQQVANYLGTSKGSICGLFFRHGDRIEMLGYTIQRRGRRETKKDSNL